MQFAPRKYGSREEYFEHQPQFELPETVKEQPYHLVANGEIERAYHRPPNGRDVEQQLEHAYHQIP